MEQPTPFVPTCKRAGCENAARMRSGLCRECYIKRDYRPCNACGDRRHKRSASGLCSRCYWERNRSESPFTGMTKREYDAQRYDSAKRRADHLKKKYGITPEQYRDMYERQNGSCGICLAPFSEANLTHGNPVIDHCHATGKVRGLLCDPCNRGLGQFRDNRNSLLRAADYLIAT